jgi:uncharacterized PurR-regulated membrane protein YhhQ (DUF165 family)
MTSPRGLLATSGWIALFVACIALANWSLLHVGLDNGPGRPRTIPLGLGWNAPSGVIFAGALLTVRDVIHDRIGQIGTLAVIVASAPLTAVLSSKAIATASVVTFLLAESVDLAIYSSLRRRGRTRAVLVSNVISGVTDSFVFLAIAFGLQAAVRGAAPMAVGKIVASLVTLLVIDAFRRRLIATRRNAALGDRGSPRPRRALRAGPDRQRGAPAQEAGGGGAPNFGTSPSARQYWDGRPKPERRLIQQKCAPPASARYPLEDHS